MLTARFAAPLLVAVLAAPGTVRAEPPPGPPGPPGPPVSAAQRGISGISEGVLQRYLTTPYGELNGLRLADGRLVMFGPMMGPSVAQLLPVGARLRIIGQSAPDGAMRASALINLDSGKSVEEAPPGPPPPPRQAGAAALTLQRCEAAGLVELILHGPRGEANGVLLDSGAMIYFRPGLVAGTLQPGQPFAAIGIGTQAPSGLAMEAFAAGADLASVRQAVSNNQAQRPPLPPRESSRHVD